MSAYYEDEQEVLSHEYVVQVTHPKHGRIFMEVQHDLRRALDRVEAHRALGTDPVLFIRTVTTTRGDWERTATA